MDVERSLQDLKERAPSPGYLPGTVIDVKQRRWWHGDRFTGALMFNTVSFLLPAAYMTLSKLWVANINSSLVATTDVYIYIGVIAQVFNEGLPRAAWVTIGDASSRPYEYRLKLSYTLIFFQSALGLIISMIFAFAAKGFANGFLPPEIRAVSLDYVRISSFSAFSSALEVSVANTTRALDKPNVPLLIGTIKIAVNIVLDMLIISQFHVGTHAPTINAQAWIRLACDMTAAFSGLIYFLYLTFRQRRQYSLETGEKKAITPSFSALKVLAPPGITTFLESAVRNALYLWLVTRIVSMGSTYATAWGVFNTIRWGLLMVPVQALEATALTFVGHAWGQWRSGVGDVLYAKTMRGDLFHMIRPALISAFIALVIELPICLFLTLFGWRSFARYLSGSDAVATLTFHMWRTIDWTYILFAVSTQLATILLASSPRWHLYQSLATSLLYVLPWAIACQTLEMDASNAWTYHGVVFEGMLVVGFFCVLIVDGVWAWRLQTGRMRLDKVKEVGLD